MNALKRLLSLALLVMACSTVTGQGLLTLNDDPLSYENLRGPVKEMELLDMSVYEDGETTIWDTIYLLFNEDGQILQRICFMNAEYPYLIYLYTNGRLTEEKWWNNYDSIRRQYHYSPNGCLSYAVEFYYEEGEQKIYDTNQYHCDSLCRITMQIHNHFQDTVRCTYDENGRMTKWCNWERCEEGCDGCTTFIYNSQGLLVKEQSRHRYSNGDKEYIYNEKGFVSTYIDNFTGEENTIHYEYTYDSYDNWVTRRSNNNFIIRKITYYE